MQRKLARRGYTPDEVDAALVRLEVVVSVENAASLRVAEKAGAIREGVLRSRLLLHGRMHDAVMLAFVRP